MMSLKVCLLVICLSVSCFASPVDNPSQVEQQQVNSQKVADVPGPVNVVPVLSNSSPQETVVQSEENRKGKSYSPKENDITRPHNQVEESLLQKLNLKCSQRDPSSCAMLKLITYMNRLFKKANINIADNIEITQTTVTEVKAEDMPRLFSQETPEAQTAELLTAKLLSFVRSRALRLRLIPTMEAVITSNPDAEGNLNLGMSFNQVSPSVQEGRGKGKKYGGLIAMMAMKAAMMKAMALKALALLVGKALIVSKIALLLAIIIGLKKLLHQEKHVTYEVHAQPHHTHSHVNHVETIEHGHSGSGGGGESYSSGWGRSVDLAKRDSHSMAYRAYVPKQ